MASPTPARRRRRPRRRGRSTRAVARPVPGDRPGGPPVPWPGAGGRGAQPPPGGAGRLAGPARHRDQPPAAGPARRRPHPLRRVGRRQRRLALPLWLVLAVCGFFWPGWWVWCVLVLLLGLFHPPVRDESVPLDPVRRRLAWLAWLMLLLSFIPVPIEPLTVTAGGERAGTLGGGAPPFRERPGTFRGDASPVRTGPGTFGGDASLFRERPGTFRGGASPFRERPGTFRGDASLFRGSASLFRGDASLFRANAPLLSLRLLPSAGGSPRSA